jgi:SpoVK/Ycf46/Vps4 family AAA+-type ATPase
MTDSAVLASLEAALAASPDNDPLRLHLVSLLLDAGEAQRALDHCTTLLARRPDDVSALQSAARAADALGDSARADAWRRLALALGAVPQTTAPEEPSNVVPLSLVRGGAESDAEQGRITLRDVGGMEEVKRRLNLAFLAPMRNPELRRMYGKTLRGGLLLYGPPGCGKTFIARAVAGELGARFVSVGLADVLDMWLGQSERNLHELFEQARRSAPTVLFFDEIDALGRKRSLVRHSSVHNVVNVLLSEMDSVNASNEGVFVLAATNHPWDVDSALRRAGRFDRMLLVLPPDRAAREAILEFHLRERPLAGIDIRSIAARCEDFSGADLAHLCDSAAELAMEESVSTGKVRPIGMEDFQRALKEVRPSTRSWFETARNFAQFANEGGMYDDLLAYMRARRIL